MGTRPAILTALQQPAQAADIACLITKTDSNPFFVKMKEGAQKKADELGMTLKAYAGKMDGDNESQVAAMESCIADNAKGSPEGYLSRHVNGKGWGAIAHDNNVPLDKINARLDKLQRDLEGTTGSNRNLPATGRERGRNSRH